MSETRDFGNSNDSWTDQILTDYFVFDLSSSYELFNGYDLNFGISNIFDEEYQHAHEYSASRSSFYSKIKASFIII